MVGRLLLRGEGRGGGEETEERRRNRRRGERKGEEKEIGEGEEERRGPLPFMWVSAVM